MIDSPVSSPIDLWTLHVIGQDVNKISTSSISQNMFPPNPLPMAVPNNPSTRTYNKIHTSILRYCHDIQSNFQLHLTLWPQKKLTWSSLRTIDKFHILTKRRHRTNRLCEYILRNEDYKNCLPKLLNSGVRAECRSRTYIPFSTLLLLFQTLLITWKDVIIETWDGHPTVIGSIIRPKN